MCLDACEYVIILTVKSRTVAFVVVIVYMNNVTNTHIAIQIKQQKNRDNHKKIK